MSRQLNRIKRKLHLFQKGAFVVPRTAIQQELYTPMVNKYEFLKFPTTFHSLMTSGKPPTLLPVTAHHAAAIACTLRARLRQAFMTAAVRAW